MLSLRSLRTPSTSLRRWSSTVVQQVISTEDAGEAAPVRTGPRRRTKYSAERSREWNPAVRPGKIPAYDEALKYINQDSARLKKELVELTGELEKTKASVTTAKPAQKHALEARIQELEKKIPIIEVQSEINLPQVRWKVANAMGDMTIPSHRYLKEQKWRKEGDLDMLMERVYQMSVVPDVLPEIRPTLELRMTTPALQRTTLLTNTALAPFPTPVEPGGFILPKQTRNEPKLYTSTFHTDERLYTLVMLDPDVPDPQNTGFSTYLHWMQTNIPRSASLPTRVPTANALLPYVPPHPQNGSPYHRYVIILIPQTTRLEPSVAPQSRSHFDLRAFMSEHRLDQVEGGGIQMFRQVWDEDVSRIYADVLEKPEPKYGRPRLTDRTQYTQEARGGRYV